MNFVILDLEWNSAYSKSAHRFVNEIIEFGAVKVDGDFNEIGSFSRLITPKVKKNLNGRVKQLTHLTNEDMEGGGRIPFLKSYCDLQEYCEKAIGQFDEGSQIGLGRFAEIIGVEFSEEEQHRAAADAYLSLKNLKKVMGGYPLEECVMDADCEEFYDRMLFKNYFITDIASPEIDREQLKFFCGQCGKQAQRVKRWKLHNKNFNADFYCKNCDTRFTGRVSFKKRFDGVKVNRKIILKAEKKE